MRIPLSTLWNGEPLPAGTEGVASLSLGGPGGGGLDFRWELPLVAPLVLPDAPASFLDGLWEYDVVELFLTAGEAADQAPYVELEMGPSGHWLALGFASVRERTRLFDALRPEFEQGCVEGRWTGRAVFPMSELQGFLGPPPYRGLVAACLGTAPARRYLCAPALPGPRPDFHQPAAWPIVVPS